MRAAASSLNVWTRLHADERISCHSGQYLQVINVAPESCGKKDIQPAASIVSNAFLAQKRPNRIAKA